MRRSGLSLAVACALMMGRVARAEPLTFVMLADYPVDLPSAGFLGDGVLLVTEEGTGGVIVRVDERLPIAHVPWSWSKHRVQRDDEIFMVGNSAITGWSTAGSQTLDAPIVVGDRYALQLEPWGNDQLLVFFSDGEVQVLDASGQSAGPPLNPPDTGYRSGRNDVTADGSRLAMFTSTGLVVLDHQGQRHTLPLSEDAAKYAEAYWSPDGDHLAVYASGTGLVRWTPPGDTTVSLVESPNSKSPRVAWAPDSKSLYAWSEGALVQIGLDGAVIATLPTHKYATQGGLRLSNDGSLLLQGGDLHQLPSMDRVHFRTPWAPTAAALHPSRPWIALDELDGGLRVVDWHTGQTVWRAEVDKVENVAWSADGTLLAVAADEQGLLIYDDKGTQLHGFRLGADGTGAEVLSLFCREGELRANVDKIYARSITGSLQWAPGDPAVLFTSDTPSTTPTEELEWYLIHLDEPGKILKSPWGRTVFADAGLHLLVNAPNGDRARIDLPRSACHIEDVGTVDPFVSTLPDSRPVSGSGGRGVTVGEGDDARFLPTPSLGRETWSVHTPSSLLGIPALAPLIIDPASGHWVQLYADDRGVAAVDSDGRFWADEGAEGLLAVWSGSSWTKARHLSDAQVAKKRDPSLWTALPCGEGGCL